MSESDRRFVSTLLHRTLLGRGQTQLDPRATLRPTVERASEARLDIAPWRTALGESAPCLSNGEVLGQGGMGVIRLGRQSRLSRPVAVKSLRPDRGDPQWVDLLLREAWVTGQLEHPNIVPVHDIHVDELGQPHVLLKRINGTDWDDQLGKSMGAAEEASPNDGDSDALAEQLRIFISLCRAVAFAHSRGFIHRDIKPANVMVGAFGEVYLLDWGLALRSDEAQSLVEPEYSSEPVVGTPAYMAPEMLDPLRFGAPGPHTDVYLLGATLFHVLVGRGPHEGDELDDIFASVIRSEPEFPSAEDSTGLPPALVRIVGRAMAARPEERYPDAESLRVDVLRYLDRRGLQRLLERSLERLSELNRHLASEEAVTQEVYDLYSACRFGFLQILEVDAAEEQAREGLREAIVGMARFEFERGRAQAAESYLQELAEPPRALARAVIRALERERLEREQLEQFQRENDSRSGERVRTRLVLAVGLFTIVTCLLGGFAERWLFGGRPTYTMVLGASGLFFVFAFGLYWWTRVPLGETLFNRRVLGALLLTPVMQIMLGVGAYLSGLPAEVVVTFHPMLWAGMAAVLASSEDIRLAPGALGYTAAFLVAVTWPEWKYMALTGGNVIMTVCALFVWGHGSLSSRSRV